MPPKTPIAAPNVTKAASGKRVRQLREKRDSSVSRYDSGGFMALLDEEFDSDESGYSVTSREARKRSRLGESESSSIPVVTESERIRAIGELEEIPESEHDDESQDGRYSDDNQSVSSDGNGDDSMQGYKKRFINMTKCYNEAKITIRQLKSEASEQKKDFRTQRQCLEMAKRSISKLEKELETIKRMSEARAFYTGSADGSRFAAEKKKKRIERKGDAAGKRARALMLLLEGEHVEVRTTAFAIANAAVNKKSDIRSIMDGIAKLLVSGSPSASIGRVFMANIDADICTSASSANSQTLSSSAGIVHIPSILTPGFNGCMTSELNAVPRNPLITLQEGPLYTSSLDFDCSVLCDTILHRVDWNSLAMAQGESASTSASDSIFGGTDSRRKGIQAALSVEHSVVVREFDGRVKALAKSKKEHVFRQILSELNITPAGKRHGLVEHRKLSKIILEREVCSDVTKLKLNGAQTSQWRQRSSLFDGTEDDWAETEPTGSWVENGSAINLIQVMTGRAGSLGASTNDFARTGAILLATILTSAIRVKTVDAAMDWAHDSSYNLKMSIGDQMTMFWDQTSTGVWTKVHTAIMTDLAPVCAMQLLIEARSIVTSESDRPDDIFSWIDSEVESGNCDLTRMPKKSIDGEVLAYKSYEGKKNMTVSSDFAKKYICTQIFPVSDIVVGVMENASSGANSPGTPSFVTPSIGSGHIFDMASALGEFRSGLRIKCKVFDAEGNNGVDKTFSLF